MRADEVKSPALFADRPPDNILIRPVLEHEVEDGRSEAFEPDPLVPDKGDGFEKDLGQENRRSDVDMDTALESADKGGEGEKITKGPLADRRAVGARMEMNDVRAQGDMDGDGNPEPMARGKKAEIFVGESRAGDHPSDRRAEAEAVLHAVDDRPVEKFSRFPGGPEAAGHDLPGHIFRSPAGESDFEIVDDSGPVEGQPLDKSSFHEVNENRLKADFDDMGPAGEKDGAPMVSRPGGQGQEFTKIPAGEETRERIKEFGDRRGTGERFREPGRGDFAFPSPEGIRFEALRRQEFFHGAGDQPTFVLARRPFSSCPGRNLMRLPFSMRICFCLRMSLP